MKLLARHKHFATMNQYLAVIGTDPGGNETTTYVLKGAIKGTIASGRQQTYLYTDVALGFGDQLKNVHDSVDQPLFVKNGVEYPVYVHDSTPVVDIYGRVTSHRQVLRDFAPTDPISVGHIPT